MIKSMTGFGRGEYSINGREYVVEIKTINHRYLDINARFPRQYSFFEDYCRKVISKSISRGKVDVIIQFNNFNSDNKKVLFDDNIVKTYLNKANEVEKELGIKNDLTFSNIIQLPDIIKLETSDNEEELIKEFSVALNNALENLGKMREVEGSNLKVDLLNKCNNLLENIEKIEKDAMSLTKEYKTKLETRINDLLKDVTIKIDETRLITEVALFADKASIDEEIVRFKSHVNQLKSTLELSEPIGKKLDFIVQEINRETNTIGAKANCLAISKIVIELKNEIEKIREQVQNIE